MISPQLKNKAIKLRKIGKTYGEIQKAIGPIAKSTLSNWLKPITLTEAQKNRIAKKISNASDLGRQKAGWRNHQKRLERIGRIRAEADKEFPMFLKNRFFIAGLILYLAEGSKKKERFEFMNSDPYLITLMVKWLCLFGKIAKKDIKLRLYAHKLYADKNYERFWSNFLKIPSPQFLKTIYKPTPHTVKKNQDYKGCLRVEISGNELFWKIMKWRDMFYINLSNLPPWRNG